MLDDLREMATAGSIRAFASRDSLYMAVASTIAEVQAAPQGPRRILLALCMAITVNASPILKVQHWTLSRQQ